MLTSDGNQQGTHTFRKCIAERVVRREDDGWWLRGMMRQELPLPKVSWTTPHELKRI